MCADGVQSCASVARGVNFRGTRDESLAPCTLVRYRDEELELGEVVNFQVPVNLDSGRRWLEAGQTLVSGPTPFAHVLSVEAQQPRRLSQRRIYHSVSCCPLAPEFQADPFHRPDPTMCGLPFVRCCKWS